MTDVRTEVTDESTVVVRAIVGASQELVFRAFTNPEELARWWWPEALQTAYEVEAAVGGTFTARATALPEGQVLGVRATFREVTSSRLKMSWAWLGEGNATDVTIEFVPLGPAMTEVVVTHSANASPEERDRHGQGWHDCLTRLVESA
jgi:uncharacterized protein YndB with AHSA1/START domain